MAVTIVETAGAADANSFVSVAEADLYIEARLNSSAWTGTEPKKQALVEATREISAMSFAGYRTDSTQALSWPRTSARNPDAPAGTTNYETTVIPQRVKDACCELALQFLKAGTTDIASADSTAGVIREKVDVLETEYAHPSQRPQGVARYPRVMKLLAPLLAVGIGQVRLVR